MTACIGCMNTGLIGLYIMFHTAPNWNRLVAQPHREEGTASVAGIMGGYLVLLIMAGAHFLSFGYVLRYSGAVSGGVNKAVQVTLVIAPDPAAHSVNPTWRRSPSLACRVCISARYAAWRTTAMFSVLCARLIRPLLR